MLSGKDILDSSAGLLLYRGPCLRQVTTAYGSGKLDLAEKSISYVFLYLQ